MAPTDQTRQYVPLTCHGHSRPVTHINFSNMAGKSKKEYYLISACKDGNPMLRDGMTGDWIGTFFGHKGAVWQARLAADASVAATASADFHARVWDTHTGETKFILKHNHIVRAIAFPPRNARIIATGGFEKKLRIFDLSDIPIDENNPIPTIDCSAGYEIGQGIIEGVIKYIVWANDENIIVTASDDKVIRWWDLRSQQVVQELPVTGDVGSCEVNYVFQGASLEDIGGGRPVLTIAAGKTVYFYGGDDLRTLIKKIDYGYEVASAAIHLQQRKIVVCEKNGTWARVYNFDTGAEQDVHKGHHGPIWSVAFSPDGKLYATGSEDGTIKMWKNCDGPFGLWMAESSS